MDSVSAAQDFLARQAAQATADLRSSVRCLARDVRAATSLRGWVREHPVATLAASALASFGAGFGLGTSLRGQGKRAVRDQRKSQEEPPAVRPPAPGPVQAEAASGGSSIWRRLVSIAGFLTRTGLKVAAFASAPPPAAVPPRTLATNGSHPAAAASAAGPPPGGGRLHGAP